MGHSKIEKMLTPESDFDTPVYRAGSARWCLRSRALHR